jgi:hypothetical protein
MSEKTLLPPTFYLETSPGYYIAARAKDEFTLAKHLINLGEALFAIWSPDRIEREMAKLRAPYELKVQEWWLA